MSGFNGVPAGDNGGQGGGDQSGGQQNQNQGGAQNPPGGQNNNGQFDELAAIWNEDAGGNNQPPKSEAGNKANESAEDGKVLDGILNNVKFDSIFSDDAMAEMGEGRMDKLNENMGNVMRSTMRQTLLMTAQMMHNVQATMRDEIRSMVQQGLTDHTDSQDLGQQIPYANDPAVGPLVKSAYAQAKKAGKTHAQAVAIVKGLTQHLADKVDSSLGEAPRGDGGRSPKQSDGNVGDWAEFARSS